MIWRIVTSDRISATLPELKTSWSFGDLMDAHAVLDALEQADNEARDEAAKTQRPPR